MKVLLIIPVCNEAATIYETSESIDRFCRKTFDTYSVLFIDDKSTDKTAQALHSINVKNKLIVRNYFDAGKGSALKTAYVFSHTVIEGLNSPDDLIIFLDGDGQIDPSEIKVFLKLMDLYEADVVVGNKRHKYSYTFYGIVRKVISITYNILVRLLLGINFQDTQCGLKIFKKKALDSIIESINVKEFAFDVEILVACREQNMRIIDAPVFIKRQMNAGSISLRNIIVTLLDTLKIWGRKLTGYYKRGKGWQK